MDKSRPFLDEVNLSLDEWLGHLLTPDHKRKYNLADYEFPTDRHREEFLDSIDKYPDSTIKEILRCFLIKGGTLGIDQHHRKWIYSISAAEKAKLVEEYEYINRLIQPPFRPWDGIHWILDLLPNEPRKALDVLDAYFSAYCQFLPDGRINSISDAEAIIQKRYVHRNNPRETLLSLQPSEFEKLIGTLYKSMGYEISITQASHDGGIDIKAEKNEPGGRIVSLIQCKRYVDVVRVQAVRELMGVVSRFQANKGIIITTSDFTKSARKEAQATAMIELIDYSSLNKLLNLHKGANWPSHIKNLVRDFKNLL